MYGEELPLFQSVGIPCLIHIRENSGDFQPEFNFRVTTNGQFTLYRIALDSTCFKITFDNNAFVAIFYERADAKLRDTAHVLRHQKVNHNDTVYDLFSYYNFALIMLFLYLYRLYI